MVILMVVVVVAISMVVMTTINKQVMVMGGLGEEHSVMKLVLGQNNWYLFLFLQIYSHLLARAGTCTGTCTCTWTCTCTCTGTCTGTCFFLRIYSHSKYIHLWEQVLCASHVFPKSAGDENISDYNYRKSKSFSEMTTITIFSSARLHSGHPQWKAGSCRVRRSWWQSV